VVPEVRRGKHVNVLLLLLLLFQESWNRAAGPMVPDRTPQMCAFHITSSVLY
jgi:hypothetical protein